MLYQQCDDEARLQFAYIRLEIKLSSIVSAFLTGLAIGDALLPRPRPSEPAGWVGTGWRNG